MSDKQHPKPVLATTKLAADLDRIVLSVGHKGSSWRKTALRSTDVETISGKPGAYFFLLPEGALPKERAVILHGRTFGPKHSRRQLQVKFSYQPKMLGDSVDLVVYVGKAANIRARIKGHLSIDPQATTNQVLRGLIGKPHTQITREVLKDAKKTLEEHGSIFYVEHFHVDELADCRTSDDVGECLVAERDLLEIKLIAAYAPPFNIKAER